MKFKLKSIVFVDLSKSLNALALLSVLSQPLAYSSEEGTHTDEENNPKSCMTVRTLHESLSLDSFKFQERAKYRRMLRKHGFRSAASSYDSLGDVVDRDDGLPLMVSFGSVTIRKYPIMLGDNPCVSRGAPVTIDWEYQSEHEVDLSRYEAKKKAELERMLRAGDDDMPGGKIPYMLRNHLLTASGYTQREIQEKIYEVRKAQKKRFQTARIFDDHIEYDENGIEKKSFNNKLKNKVNKLRFQLDEKWELVSRSVSNIFAIRKKKQERQMLSKSLIIDQQRLDEADLLALQEAKALDAALKEIDALDSALEAAGEASLEEAADLDGDTCFFIGDLDDSE